MTDLMKNQTSVTDAWSRSVTRLVRHSDQAGARVIGLVGMHPRVGVSTLARRLAWAFAEFGKPTLLVDVSIPGQFQAVPYLAVTGSKPSTPSERLQPFVKVADTGSGATSLRSDMRTMLEAVAQGQTVIVDLPSVEDKIGTRRSTQTDAAGACDIAYLVCLSGTAKKTELANSIEVCRINGLKVGGIVANDWKLMGSHLLASQ
jgi:Mrp family chromosome partitioning ATPase